MAPLAAEEAASDGSSNSRLSSPPLSPPQINTDEIAVATRRQPNSAIPGIGDGVAANPPAATSAHNQATQPGNATLPTAPADAPPKTKRPRKVKDQNPDSKDEKPVKEKKTRKAREPKVKKEADSAAANTTTSTSTTAAPRKRQKIEGKSTATPADAPVGPRQSTITEMVNQYQPPAHSAPAPPPPASGSASSLQPPPPPYAIPPTSSTSWVPPLLDTNGRRSATPTPRPYSSGQNYDPIRGSTIDSAPSRPSAIPTNGVTSAQASPRINNASASPSIISLIDPPQATKMSAPPMSYSPQTVKQQSQPLPFVPSQQQAPPSPRATHSTVTSAPAQHDQADPVQRPILASSDGAMDIDGPTGEAANKPPPEVKLQSKSSSSAPTPKPVPAKVISPPKATGSGLLSSSDLFGGPSAGSGAERQGVDIDIRITLNPSGGNTVNMAQEIIKKYGRDALNPRVAAHRERLLQVAAAANRLDVSADDMSVDLMSEVDGDSNVEMGGLDDEKSATGADETKRKRKKKVEEYDKEDDFIDDTELAWQEQAAVAKDGFFVYSGPLIPQGQNAQVESATSTRGRGGRGRGRSRAAAAATAAAAGTTHTSVAEKLKDASAASTSRARGRGRGTGTNRKPRVTKADRERMELEKQEREKSAGGGSSLPSAMPAMLHPSPSHAAGTLNPPVLASNASSLQQQQPPPQNHTYAPNGNRHLLQSGQPSVLT